MGAVMVNLSTPTIIVALRLNPKHNISFFVKLNIYFISRVKAIIFLEK